MTEGSATETYTYTSHLRYERAGTADDIFMLALTADEDAWSIGNSAGKTIDETIKPFVQSALHAAIQNPYDGLSQFVDHITNKATGVDVTPELNLFEAPEPAQFGTREWHAQTFGSALGAILPLMIAARGAKGFLRTPQTSAGLLSRRAALGLSVKEAAATGFIADFLFRPNQQEGDFLLQRFTNGFTGAATFSAMTATSLGLQGLSSRAFLKQTVAGRALANPIFNGVLSGIPGGAVSAELESLIHNSRLASGQDLGQSIYTMSIIGGAFGAKHQISQSHSVQDMYWRTRIAFSDGKTNALRGTYSLLNKYNMRHPLQRLGKLVRGNDSAYDAPRAPLTHENNPVSAFERALPQYFERTREMERQLEQTGDRNERHQIYEQMDNIQTEFVYELLNIWHGSKARPGMVSYSNAELATPHTSEARVAEIKNALTLTAKSDYPHLNPLTRALADLMPVELRSEFGTNHEITKGLSTAKERFFGYNERELARRMAMPAELYHQKRAYSTPVEWMPFTATEQLPNLFHGTVSSSLPSIFTERAMLPASELRLRGINQKTGECAGQEFPRRSISITTDFNEAWAYHRHSPETITSYPVIIGISRDVTPRVRPAGLLEPGELLIQKLRVGETMLTKLGLRKPEVTHLFAPVSQVSAISRLLARQRIKGVQVVGLDRLKAPEWIEPAKDTD